MDRGGTLGSDGLFESGFNFLTFCAKICHLRFEKEKSLSEVGDGEVCKRFWVCCIWVTREVR